MLDKENKESKVDSAKCSHKYYTWSKKTAMFKLWEYIIKLSQPCLNTTSFLAPLCVFLTTYFIYFLFSIT